MVSTESKYLSHRPLHSREFLGLAAKSDLRPAESGFQLSELAAAPGLDVGDRSLCPCQPPAPRRQHAFFVYFRQYSGEKCRRSLSPGDVLLRRVEQFSFESAVHAARGGNARRIGGDLCRGGLCHAHSTAKIFLALLGAPGFGGTHLFYLQPSRRLAPELRARL